MKATHRMLIDRLPNVLCIAFKRFIYTDRLIKNKDIIEFDEVLKIDDSLVSPSLKLGVFNKIVAEMVQPKYRLFSVVEHIGQ